MRNIKIFAIAAHGTGISGSDRIFIEFARRWQKSNRIIIYVNEEGKKMCLGQKLLAGSNLKYIVWKTPKWAKLGFTVIYFYRITRSVFEALKISIKNNKDTVLYSASEFWMDSLPAFILKVRFSKVNWTASWYQTAPNPIIGFAEGKREKTYNFKALLYFLAQYPIKPLISSFCNYVLVNNQLERKQFPKLNSLDKIKVVIGAVDLEKISKWKKTHRNNKKIYDAVFQGRFHPQKGVVELIDIWRIVVNRKSDAKMALIGDGPLMGEVEDRIEKLGLKKNIDLLGYVFDGDLKYETFARSKMVVHPALYDSGGMASAEVMAFGVPAIGFDLKAYESYYPKGMVKVEKGDIKKFAHTILKLLVNKKLRDKIAIEGMKMLKANWSWDKRADEVLRGIT